jgi:hypothetical protein
MKRQELWAQAESDEQPDILGKFLIGFSSSHAFCLMWLISSTECLTEVRILNDGPVELGGKICECSA